MNAKPKQDKGQGDPKIDEKTREKYMQYNLLVSHIQQIEQQIVELQNQVLELRTVQKNLDDLGLVQAPKESFFQVAPGIYVKGELRDKDKLLVKVGGDVLTVKDREETRMILEGQIQNIVSLLEQFQRQLERYSGSLNSLRKDIGEGEANK